MQATLKWGCRSRTTQQTRSPRNGLGGRSTPNTYQQNEIFIILWDFAELNYIAIFVAAIVRMVIAMIWYHSGVFGKVWMNEALGAQRVENYDLKVFYAFLTTLVAATVLAGFISHAGDVSWWDGA